MRTKTKYEVISAVNIGAEYDKGMKKLFQSKEIIVPLVEMVVPEFAGYSQQEILKCLDLASITSEEIVSDTVVSQEDEYRILGEDTELTGAADKLVRFDSKFRICNPKLSQKNMLVNLHIDLEGQKSYTPKNPNYPIVKRALYYVARDLSGQLGTVTGKTNYVNLEKCYSIWICLEDVPKRLQNTMTEYKINKKDILGETDEPEKDYDLMSVIIIRLGGEMDTEGIFDYLYSVFRGDLEKIESYSQIEWEEDFREEITMTMTGFGDVLVRKGINEGREIGKKLGEEIGKKLGEEIGKEIGKEENTVKVIWNMHQMDFADEIISKAVEQPVDYVREVLKKAPPL